MKAILSDVHGNLEALQAVLADATRQGAKAVYCLGDLVGYGPDPCACVELAMQWSVVLVGNHDWAALHDPEGFSVSAQESLLWAMAQLRAPEPNREASERRCAFLAGLPRTFREGEFLFVHGTPCNPLNEYVFPEDVGNERKLGRVFASVARYCFGGHTHVPGVFTEDFRFRSPAELGHAYRLDDRKVLVNVGSVGQPRDGDWRACYVLLDGSTVHFRRVEYDLEATARKVYATPELANFLGDRLREGR